MDIVIVAQYMGDIQNLGCGNSRFWYIAQLLKGQGHQVEIISSDYYHEKKKSFDSLLEEQDGVKITLCHESGYPKNVCLRRFASHKKLAKNMEKYINCRKKPDVIYAAVPSLDVAYMVSKHCKKNKILFIADIQDLWPEAFKMVVNVPVISDIVYHPMTKKANKIYKTANDIIAVSETYLRRGLQVNERVKGHVIYLGTDKVHFDACTDQIERKTHDKLRLVYVGTLGSSYDLPCVFEAIRKLPSEYQKRIEFIVIGDGPRRKEFEFKANGLPVYFLGRLTYAQMVQELASCDIAVNPIAKGSAQSIINKHMDYAMAGLPVINTQECLEYRDLIKEWRCGINCECGDSESVADAICELVTNEKKRISMGKASRKMGEKLFDRAKSYNKIVDIILKGNVDDTIETRTS